MTASDFRTDIFKRFEDVWAEKILSDFTVIIDEQPIKCHRMILAACSDYFMAMFQSGMKEATENCIVLNDVSYDVFTFILNSLYTGLAVLTSENYLEVWRATDMLQITFMANMCETMAIEEINVDTWENIYTTAHLLSSDRVLHQLQLFMVQNFEKIRLSPLVLQISFQDFRDLIKSQDLVVSNEDLVLETVIRWVNYDPTMTAVLKENLLEENPHKHRRMMFDSVQPKGSVSLIASEDTSRKDKFSDLLKHVRTCLVSPAVLSHLYKMELISENKDSRDIVFNAISYNVHDFRHGQWPSGAIHRSCSDYIQGGVFAHLYGCISFISADDEKFYHIARCSYVQETIQLIVFNGELFIIGKSQITTNDPCKMFVFSENNWKFVTKMPCDDMLLVSHGDFMYILNKDLKKIYKINPKKNNDQTEYVTDFPALVDVKHAMVFENCFLLFCSEFLYGIKDTAVHKFDISSKAWTRLDNINGPADQLISFRNDNHHYILQNNGSMRLIQNIPHTGEIEFKFLDKIWNINMNVYGAITYRGKVMFLGNCQPNELPGEKCLSQFPEHFEIIRFWGTDKNNCSNFVPVTFPRVYLNEISKKNQK
ncbi:kelch-like protein 3 [Physella acuta]|uniref:kelch-like protein 3 n=1 Tax=Physella acuta TaxID=109671 RepID=UPI0027DC9540|nr:kelch-like protein 3 [Physella acuta]